MSSVLKYNLEQFHNISSNGFQFEIPEDTFNMLNYLCVQVGSTQLTSRIKTYSKTNSVNNMKRKQQPDFSNVRSFQTTKLQQKTGFDAELDQIRLLLNKLTDKTFLDIKNKITERINRLCSEEELDIETNFNNFNKLGNVIYDICSTNKFYSKIFAELFVELATTFEFIRNAFEEKYSHLSEQYNDIKYVDSNKDYDGFCEMNKTNEKRKSVTSFYLNLALIGFIQKENIVSLLKDILVTIINMIQSQEYKNEVDELTENVSILFNKEMIESVLNESINVTNFDINERNIIETVRYLSTLKTKDYPGLSNKAIFKYMDLVDL